MDSDVWDVMRSEKRRGHVEGGPRKLRGADNPLPDAIAEKLAAEKRIGRRRKDDPLEAQTRQQKASKAKVRNLARSIANLTPEELSRLSISAAVSAIGRTPRPGSVTPNFGVAVAMFDRAEDGDVGAAKFLRESDEGALRQTLTVELSGVGKAFAEQVRDMTLDVFAGDERLEEWVSRLGVLMTGLASMPS